MKRKFFIVEKRTRTASIVASRKNIDVKARAEKYAKNLAKAIGNPEEDDNSSAKKLISMVQHGFCPTAWAAVLPVRAGNAGKGEFFSVPTDDSNATHVGRRGERYTKKKLCSNENWLLSLAGTVTEV